VEGSKPLVSVEEIELFAIAGERPGIPSIKFDIPKKIGGLIKVCWNQDPNERPSFAIILDLLFRNKIVLNLEMLILPSAFEPLRDDIVNEKGGDAQDDSTNNALIIFSVYQSPNWSCTHLDARGWSL
jgi:hypothetical protein